MKKISRRTFTNNIGLGIGALTIAPTLSSFTILSEKKRMTYNGKKLNIALCGLGRYGTLLGESFKDSEYCNLAGIITGTPSKAKKWKAQYNIPEKNIYNYENFDSIVNNKDIDLVAVFL